VDLCSFTVSFQYFWCSFASFQMSFHYIATSITTSLYYFSYIFLSLSMGWFNNSVTFSTSRRSSAYTIFPINSDILRIFPRNRCVGSYSAFFIYWYSFV
jgi:hypothetical protein